MSKKKSYIKLAITRIFIALLFLSLQHVSYARVQSDDISIEASFGINGYFKLQTPAPLIVNVSNKDEMFDGWVLANIESWIPPTYCTSPLLIPPGSSQKIELSCYGCFKEGPCDLPVEVHAKDGSLIKKSIIKTYPLNVYDSLVVHINQPSSNISNLKHGGNPGFENLAKRGLAPEFAVLNRNPIVHPEIIAPKDLPQKPILYEGISLIAANLTTWNSLDERNKKTIKEYVTLGGNLLVYYDCNVDSPDISADNLLIPIESSGISKDLKINQFLNAAIKLVPSGIEPEYKIVNPDKKNEYLNDETAIKGSDGIKSFGWVKPNSYKCLVFAPSNKSEVFQADGTTILCSRQIGNGHAAFMAFDPFTGGPSSSDPPIRLLAFYGLLDPFCPVNRFSTESISAFASTIGGGSSFFFGPQQKSTGKIIFHWIQSMGVPLLIYILGLPVMAFLARGRGHIALALFITWSIVMTGITMCKRTLPVADTATIKEANLIWTAAESDEEVEYQDISSSHLYSFFSYTAETPSPRTVSFLTADALLDEFVDPASWRYGSVTIKQGLQIELPDLPLEITSLNQTGVGRRNFILRSSIPEIKAKAKLILSPSEASLFLETDLPLKCISGRIMAKYTNLWVGKNLDALEGNINLKIDLVPGTEITWEENLFPGKKEPPQLEIKDVAPAPSAQQIGRTLESFWNLIFSTVIESAQRYSKSQTTGRPSQVYIVLASKESSTEIKVSRGSLNREAVTLIIISVPIEYHDE